MDSDDDLRDRVQRLERRVDFLLRHFGLAEQAMFGQPQQFEDVVAMKRAGKVIDAIKRYRELTGLGLKEAKDFVERIR